MTAARCTGKGKTRGCGQPIEWVVTEATGSPMPIDAEPVEGGNLIKLDSTLDDGTAIVHYLTKAERAGETLFAIPTDRYVSHFATCPNAKRFRRR